MLFNKGAPRRGNSSQNDAGDHMDFIPSNPAAKVAPVIDVMTKLFDCIKFLMLLLTQVSPLVIILYFVFVFKQPTENAGWILEEESGCKCWTNRNFEHRSFIWIGDCSNGYADGPGILHLMQDGYKHTVFEGTLSNGIATGFGKLIWLDGDRFEGEFRNGLSNGFGRLYNDDGDYYEGNFSDGQRSGRGTYWYEAKNPLLKYEGFWEAGLEHGQGILFYRNGTQVSGTFNSGVLTQANK